MLSKNEIKYIQSLRQKKSRKEAGQFIAEGPKLINDLLQDRPEDIICLYATENWIETHEKQAGSIGLKKIETFELEKISALETPQQVLATVKMQANDFVSFKDGEWLLMLDGIQDPGNMGSIIRIADWFGISTIYCSQHTVDCYNPKVVQATMGSLWRTTICYGPCEEWLANTNLPVYGSLLEGENIFKVAAELPKGILVIGSEGKGISPEILPFINTALTIPRIGKAESLNAAVASGIILGQLVLGK